MAGLLSGVLPAIYSAGDWAKRQMSNIASDPMGVAQQSLGQTQDVMNEVQLLQKQAFGNPANPLQVTDRAALDKLVSLQLNSNFNPGILGKQVGGLLKANTPTDIKTITAYHRTTTPFEGEFENRKNKLGVSFAGERGFYFSPSLDDPASQIFGKHVIAADVNIKKPAPVYQVSFGFDNFKTPRSVIPVDSKWLKENPDAAKQGGITIADSLEDVIAGKTSTRASSFKEYEEQIKQAAKNKKLFALIDPEKLYDKQVNLLQSKGFDGFNYVRPPDATSSMPSQVVAFTPEQIIRKAAGTGTPSELKSLFENLQYSDPFTPTIK